MIRVGITGGIGSGKSTVAKIFEVLGIPVYYADEAARRLMNEDPEVKQGIISNFGQASYQNGHLDRSYIANLVFSNPEKLALLNSLTHPATIRDAEEWMKKQKAPYSIKEAALLFESGSADLLDFIIGVSAPLPLRIERTARRDKISVAQIQQRMSRQMDEELKMQKCDRIIINDEQTLLIPQALKVHSELLNHEL